MRHNIDNQYSKDYCQEEGTVVKLFQSIASFLNHLNKDIYENNKTHDSISRFYSSYIPHSNNLCQLNSNNLFQLNSNNLFRLNSNILWLFSSRQLP
jgi:hypothetical protein